MALTSAKASAGRTGHQDSISSLSTRLQDVARTLDPAAYIHVSIPIRPLQRTIHASHVNLSRSKVQTSA